jgi:hypothetical protein
LAAEEGEEEDHTERATEMDELGEEQELVAVRQDSQSEAGAANNGAHAAAVLVSRRGHYVDATLQIVRSRAEERKTFDQREGDRVVLHDMLLSLLDRLAHRKPR